MRSHHDMGGLPAGTVEPADHDYQLWEKRVDAFMVLLSRKGYMTVDELRKCIESLPPDAYDKMTYYERWMASICNVLIHRGLITIDEVRAKLVDIEADPAAHSA
jgi:hypothetical protein